MSVYLADKFSLSVLPYKKCNLLIDEIDAQEVKELLGNGFISVISNQLTAKILSELLGMSINASKTLFELCKEDMLIIAEFPLELQEYKTLSEEELKNLLEYGDIRFYVVELDSIM